MAARKLKGKTKQQPAAPVDPPNDGDVTEEESIQDEEMDDISDTVDQDEQEVANETKDIKATRPIPFMDTFYQLSSDESKLRSLAARDLISHCFFSDQVNITDAAYALTRLMNGLCTGRASSRQGFASALSTFLRVAHSSNVLSAILEDCEESSAAGVFRQKLLESTQFMQSEKEAKRQGGKMKGMEERDHAFGRLFGILAVVRSGVLGTKDFPCEVTEGYTTDLIELYNYKNWLREPAANALIELLSTLDDAVVVKVANEVIEPKLLVTEGSDANGIKGWMQSLNAEQIAVALHLQRLQSKLDKYSPPLDKAILTAESVPLFAQALTATSSTVYPRCHIVWNAIWLSLTEESDGHRHLRKVKESHADSASIIESLINNVVVESLLGKGESSGTPSNEKKSCALQIVSTLTGASSLAIVLPPELISTVLCPDIVERVFSNVLCASGGIGMKTPKAADGVEGNVQHHLKSLTSTILSDLVTRCSDEDFLDRRLAFVKSFISFDPRFDVRTKTQTISTLLMMDNKNEFTEEQIVRQKQLWDAYLSFLEEAIVTADTLHKATMYVELMFKLAKRDLTSAPANEARRVIRFFMTAAFFDCSNVLSQAIAEPTPSKKKKSKKGSSKAHEHAAAPPELSSALQIKNILLSHNMGSISKTSRAIMSSRFYSLLSDFISTVNSKSRGGTKATPFYGNASKPESVYRALSEISGVASVLDLSGAKQYADEALEESSDDESPTEQSRNHMLKVKQITDEALVNECGGSGSDNTDALRAKSVFTTGCASLMISLYLQLNIAESDKEEDDDTEEDKEAIHEFIADLSEIVTEFSRVIEGESSDGDEETNPLAGMSSLLVNILSSSVGGEESGQSSASMASASKLTRETVKLAWSGVLSLMSSLHTNDSAALKKLVDEDFMNTLIESVCGPRSTKSEAGDDESTEESDAEESDDDGVFAQATDMDVDPDERQDESPQNSDIGSQSSKEEDVELDSSRLENMLLEDSDAEIDVLEHHAGADKALAQLIKMKQDTRKASQSERERVDLCNRLRCAGLLDTLFSASVFKSGWLPLDAILGSLEPILRSYKSIAKSIDKSSSSTLAAKSLNEKKALMDRLSSLVHDKLSKFRPVDDSNADEESIQKAATDVSEEIRRSLNLAHCSMCSIALVTVVRCIPGMESNSGVAEIYSSAVKDWMSRKATKVHICVFEDVIQRLPSLGATVLVNPLIAAAKSAHSGYLKCESLRLLSLYYREEKSNKDDALSKKAQATLDDCCSGFAAALRESLCDSTLHKTKNKDEVFNTTKHFASYLKSHPSSVSPDELDGLKDALAAAADSTKSAGMKNTCSRLSEEIAEIAKQSSQNAASKTPKSTTKKKKKSKK